jgi:hypothetical protein
MMPKESKTSKIRPGPAQLALIPHPSPTFAATY